MGVCMGVCMGVNVDVCVYMGGYGDLYRYEWFVCVQNCGYTVTSIHPVYIHIHTHTLL